MNGEPGATGFVRELLHRNEHSQKTSTTRPRHNSARTPIKSHALEGCGETAAVGVVDSMYVPGIWYNKFHFSFFFDGLFLSFVFSY